MLDKLDARIPARTQFAKTFELGAELQRGFPVCGFRPTRFYTLTGDLRDYGVDAILHLGYRKGEPSHKIEFVETGTKTLNELAETITKIWDVDPYTLAVMRADLAIDIEGITVPWFRDHTRFKYKQFASRIDKAEAGTEVQFVGMGTAVSQTLYAGKRPNVIRIYNKREEWLRQWRKEVRNVEKYNRGLSFWGFSPEEIEKHRHVPDTFEQFCARKGAVTLPSDILTRLERQIGGDRVPTEIDTVDKLRNLADFDAFSGLEIIASNQQSELILEHFGEGSIRDHLEGIGFRTLCQHFGSVQLACSYVTKHSKGNGRRVLDSLRPYWPPSSPAYQITAEQIRRAFRESVQRQYGETRATEPDCTDKLGMGEISLSTNPEFPNSPIFSSSNSAQNSQVEITN